MKVERPKPETLADGTKIVYPIWREDLAEATIVLPKEEPKNEPSI